MSEVQNDFSKVKSMIKKSMSVSTFVMWPLLMGLGTVAYPLISIVLTDKWIECVPFMQVFCLVFATFPIQTANLNAIKAVGRSDIFFKLEVMESIVGILLLLIGMRYGALWIAIMYFFSAIVNCILIIHESSKTFKYGFFEQIADIIPSFVASCIMGVVVYSLYLFKPTNWIIFVQVPVGVFVYILCAKVFKIESYEIIKKVINEYRNK